MLSKESIPKKKKEVTPENSLSTHLGINLYTSGKIRLTHIGQRTHRMK